MQSPRRYRITGVTHRPRRRTPLKKPLLLAGIALTGLLAAAAPALAAAAPAAAATSAANFGYYDNQPIEYEATAEVTSSPQQAQVLAHGNVVYHIVDATGNVP